MQVKVKPWVFWSLIISPILAAVIAAFYVREQNRGSEKDWVRCQAALKAKGESVNWNDFVPGPLPSDQNFFAAPKMHAWFVKNRQATNNELALALANPKSKVIITNATEAADYIVWAEQFEPEFNLIREALKRPQQRMNGAYSDPVEVPVPDSSALQVLADTLSQRAKCELLLQQSDKAMADLTLLLEFSRVLDPPPSVKSGTMMSCALKAGIIQIYLQAVAAGLNSRSWKDSQLTTLRNQLEQIDLVASLTSAMSYERASSCYLAEGAWRSIDTHQPDGSTMPKVYFYESLVTIATWDEREIESIDPKTHRIRPAQVAAVELEKSGIKHTTTAKALAGTLTKNYSIAFKYIALTQTLANEAQIVCALQIYLEAYHEYPDKLEALEPQFIRNLPIDIMSGGQLKYHRCDNGKFSLYSVGWNEADDGGIIAHDSAGREDREHGDWVWHYPTN